MHISAIVCTSKVSGYIFVNGFSMGPCSKDTGVSIPWDGKSPLFISYAPIGGNYLPTSLTFTTLDSLPVCDNIILTIWTGVVEVEFKPQKSVAYPPPLIPDELKKISFNYNGASYVVSMIDYCGVWLILERGENTVMCEYLFDTYTDTDIKVQFESPLLIRGNVDDNHFVITYEEDGFILERIGSYDCKDMGNVLSFSSNVDYEPFSIDYQKEDDNLRISKSIKSHEYKKPRDIAVDMLSSMMIGDTDYAYSLLSTSLQRAFTPNQIVDYLGSIDYIGEARYQRLKDETAITVFSQKSDNVYNAQPFVFEFDTMNKIKNIMPL